MSTWHTSVPGGQASTVADVEFPSQPRATASCRKTAASVRRTAMMAAHSLARVRRGRAFSSDGARVPEAAPTWWSRPPCAPWRPAGSPSPSESPLSPERAELRVARRRVHRGRPAPRRRGRVLARIEVVTLRVNAASAGRWSRRHHSTSATAWPIRAEASAVNLTSAPMPSPTMQMQSRPATCIAISSSQSSPSPSASSNARSSS